MLTVLSFHQGDRDAAQSLAEWINDLGGVKHHQLLLLTHKGMPLDGVVEPLRAAFGKVTYYPIGDKDPGKWPDAPNLLLRRAAVQIEATMPQPWLWMEPDAIPLEPEWLDKIAAAYALCDPKRPFMGARVHFPGHADPKMRAIPPHMSGIAVYPGKAPSLAPGLILARNVAFDVNAAKQILPQLTETKLIQHEWRPEPFNSAEDLHRLHPEAVVYHQSKDGSLVARLREMKGTTPALPMEVEKPAVFIPQFSIASTQHQPEQEKPAGEAVEARETPSAGEVMADRIREEANKLTPEQRAEAKTVAGKIWLPALQAVSPESQAEHHARELKRIHDTGEQGARTVETYLKLAGLIPAVPPKKKLGRPKRKGVAK